MKSSWSGPYGNLGQKNSTQFLVVTVLQVIVSELHEWDCDCKCKRISILHGWDAWEYNSPQTVMSGLDVVKIELTNCLSINNGVAIQLVFLDALPFLESKLAECVSLQVSASSRFFVLVFLLLHL